MNDRTPLFSKLTPQAPDSLLSIIGAYRGDPRPDKIDVGVGVYRSEHGETPVMAAVKRAEIELHARQDSKSYLGPEGDFGFLERIEPLVFGAGGKRETFAMQTPGGTGAIRLACELLKSARRDIRVFIGTPTWPNHTQILDQLELETVSFRHFDPKTQGLCFEEMMAVLETARPGDAVILHGCCHNPTGADFTLGEWGAIAELVARKGLTPLIDLAYQGLGTGLDADAAGMRLVLDAAEDSLLAYSCDKNFALYRERVGALFAISTRPERLQVAASNLRALARVNWSMPPDHGAAVVRVILESGDLTSAWEAELDTMRRRLTDLRARLAAASPSLNPLARQHGLFALLPLSPPQVRHMQERNGVYMAPSGRINIAGLTPATIDIFAQAYDACLQGVLA